MSKFSNNVLTFYFYVKGTNPGQLQKQETGQALDIDTQRERDGQKQRETDR